MSYSPALQYFCERLEGLSVGLFRLEPQNQTSNINAQSIIRFTLPSNALVDMHSFAFHFNAQTNAGTGTVAMRLPNKIESLINRVEVSVGGVAVSAGANFYNVLAHAKSVIDGDYDDAGLNHPEIITTGADNNYVDGTNLTTSEQPSNANSVAQFCVNKWCGFLGECEPRVLDTSLMGDIVITIYLEQNNIGTTTSDGITDASFILSTTAEQSTFTLNNIYATIRCYSMANGVYDNMIAEQMSQNGSLEVGFKQYFSFRDNCTGSSRFTVATQSLDRVFVAHHAQNSAVPATTTRHPVLVAGYNAIGAGNAAGDAARTLGLGKVKYIAPAFNFAEPPTTSVNLYEWQLNGAKFPQYRATAEDVLQMTRLSSKYEDKSNMLVGLRQFKDNYFVSAMKLTLDAPNARYIQGLDTRSVSLNGFYYIYNIGSARDITLFCECTSSLLISAGRQIAIVQ